MIAGKYGAVSKNAENNFSLEPCLSQIVPVNLHSIPCSTKLFITNYLRGLKIEKII